MSTIEASERPNSQVSVPNAGKAKLTVPPHKAVRCHICQELFDDEQGLIKHKLWAMKIKGTHAHCTVCTMEFKTMDAQQKHMLEAHPYDQNIVCPGCQNRFVRLAGWMKHLEHDECYGIKRADVDKNRAEKLLFAHELEKRSGSQFGDYFPVNHPSVQSAMSIVSKPYMAHPSFFKPDDFPDLKEAEESLQKGASIEDKSASGTLIATTASTTGDINNPYHPRFDENRYYNKFSGKFKCPQKSCFKTFGSAKSLVAHMKSSISHYNAKLQCPGCLRWFKDVSALTAHSESETNRCAIRHSENYRVYLTQLTGGMADVVGRNEDKTVRYDVSTEAVIKFGLAQQAQKVTEVFMTKESAELQDLPPRDPVW